MTIQVPTITPDDLLAFHRRHYHGDPLGARGAVAEATEAGSPLADVEVILDGPGSFARELEDPDGVISAKETPAGHGTKSKKKRKKRKKPRKPQDPSTDQAALPPARGVSKSLILGAGPAEQQTPAMARTEAAAASLRYKRPYGALQARHERLARYIRGSEPDGPLQY